MTSKYTLKENIGKGTFGEVQKARCLKTGKKVAIKLLKINFSNQYEVRKLTREIEILKHLSNAKTNVFSTKLLEVIVPEDLDMIDTKNSSRHNIFIVMDYVDSDLKKLFDATAQGQIVLNEQ